MNKRICKVCNVESIINSIKMYDGEMMYRISEQLGTDGEESIRNILNDAIDREWEQGYMPCRMAGKGFTMSKDQEIPPLGCINTFAFILGLKDEE